MMFSRAASNFGWLIGALAAGTVCAISIFALGRTSVERPESPSSVVRIPRPIVRFSPPLTPSGAPAQEGISAMKDLSPLFLPSDRNARLPALPLREPGDGTLDAQTASLTFRESEAAVLRSFPPVAALNGKPVSEASELDGLRADETSSLAAGFGRRSLDRVSALPRGALIEVFVSGTGQVVDIVEISDQIHPPWPQLWQPLEFLAAVDAGGLVSPLSLTVASRVEGVDTFFRDYLVRTFKVGERLGPGFYRVVVSP